MEKKTFVYVGNWSFEANPEKGKGISIFSWDSKNGELNFIETICPEIAAGQLYLDSSNGILYCNDECGERHGEIGGGGYLLAFRIDQENGKLNLINCIESLSPEPTYLCLDKSGKYMVASHCSDPGHVTKIIQNPDGSFSNEVLYDDTALVMFRINENGSIGEVCDVAIKKGAGGIGGTSQRIIEKFSGHIQLIRVISRLHCILASPKGEMLVACDKGMDKLYTFQIDREKGKLVKLNDWEAPEVGCFPRYAAFHPSKNVLYANNKNWLF